MTASWLGLWKSRVVDRTRTQVPSQPRRGGHRRPHQRQQPAGGPLDGGRRHNDATPRRHRAAQVAIAQEHQVQGLVHEQAVQVGQRVVDAAAQRACSRGCTSLACARLVLCHGLGTCQVSCVSRKYKRVRVLRMAYMRKSHGFRHDEVSGRIVGAVPRAQHSSSPAARTVACSRCRSVTDLRHFCRSVESWSWDSSTTSAPRRR